MGAVDKSRSMAAGSGCHGRMLTPGADDVIAADVSSELERLLPVEMAEQSVLTGLGQSFIKGFGYRIGTCAGGDLRHAR